MRVALRPRSFVRVAGPDAATFLQAMVSNDVEALAVGDACDALLLTAKGRVIAPLRVWRRADDDFLLLTEPELGDVVCRTLVRLRLRANADVDLEEHSSHVVFGGAAAPRPDFGHDDGAVRFDRLVQGVAIHGCAGQQHALALLCQMSGPVHGHHRFASASRTGDLDRAFEGAVREFSLRWM